MIASDGEDRSAGGSAAIERFEGAEENLKQRRIEQAIQGYHEAQRLGMPAARCAGARWICHMLSGNFEAAWRESDLIERTGAPDPHRWWDGRSFAGRRVMVRCLHGLGDTIQYVRFLPRIREMASFVCLQAQPALKELLSGAALADEVITWGEAEPEWDQQVEIVELPRILRITPAALGGGEPYLGRKKPPIRVPETSRRVGLVWASSVYNPGRSIPLHLLLGLPLPPGTRMLSLQAPPERAQLTGAGTRIEDCYRERLEEAAKLIETLDLLISVDTALAHLGGALGIPVWTLLPFEADWRWMLDRTDSPWYRSMRLFRQAAAGDWEGVVSEVGKALEGSFLDGSF